jgi:signal transduction histidine kinase
MFETEAKTQLLPDELVDSELLIKSIHLVYFRMGFALVSLVVSAVLGWLAGIGEQPVAIFYVAALVVSYTSVSLLVARRLKPQQTRGLHWFNAVLIGMDIVALSVLVHLTRGIESDLYFLYLLPTVLASHTFGRRGIFVTAFGASLAYGITLLAENCSFLPYLVGSDMRETLTVAYSRRLWAHIVTRSAMLVGVSFIWALFCEHMSQVAQQGAMRLRSQLSANNRLMAETTAQAAREQMMNAISSAIRSTLEIDQILSTTAEQLLAALGASRCAIITPAEHIGDPPAIWEAGSNDNDGRQNASPARILLESGKFKDTTDEHVQAIVNAVTPLPQTAQRKVDGNGGGDGSQPHSSSFSRQFCEFMLDNLSHYEDLEDGTMRKTFVYKNALGEPLFKPISAELSSLQFNSLLVQPITYAGDSKGVILIADKRAGRYWTESEMELVKSVSSQVSIAIEHASLVDQLSRKNRDLLHKNLHLDSKNLELRTMQSQLVHQEKMASLGRMVAGIAHELNNPVNFVHGNVPYLREYFEDLKKIIDAIEEIPAEHRKAVDNLKKTIKYDFLITDLDNIVADLAEGADRIRQIIRNLRSFSRLDEAELKEASIQEGIESTIKILNQYYGRDKIQPHCQFDDIPPVVCYPGKLNQVWMNLLSNAAQAVANVPDPQVSIRAELDGEWVIVSIADNGTGIKPQDQSKIFEPFYTTKPVGQGTGLGLSICHSIIERHGGNIWFESTPGKGTTFKVKIPLRAEPEPAAEDGKTTAVEQRDQDLSRI